MLLTSNPTADVFVPDGRALHEALPRTTHLGIGAHPDDLEILAAHGILAAFQSRTEWFCGVVVTDGRGSSRGPAYAALSEAEFCAVRRNEQRKAACLGEYAAQIQLDYRSSTLRGDDASGRAALIDDLQRILCAAEPRYVYTHNLADAHSTHVAVALATIEACKRLEPAQRPQHIWGCEVWRDLDWLSKADRVVLPLSGRPHLLQGLLSVFDSQIEGNKRYDLGTQGRRQAHATFDATDSADTTNGVTLAMDLMPIVLGADPHQYVLELIERFRGEVLEPLRRAH